MGMKRLKKKVEQRAKQTAPDHNLHHWPWAVPEDRFKRLLTLLIAGTALLGTITAALRVDASGRGAAAGRDARAFIIKAVGKGNAGTQRYTQERNLLAEFQSLVTQQSVDLRLAQEAMSRGEAVGYLQDAERLRLARENLRGFSTLLSPPYYDEKSGAIDVLRFGADYMVAPPVRWTEMQASKDDAAEALEAKSDRYVLIITILAVSLFLFGLSLTLSGRLRFMFGAVGSLITLAALVGVIATALAAMPKYSEDAIKNYVDGAGKLYHAGVLAQAGGDTAQNGAEVVRRADLATASFCRAVAIKPDYAAAHQALGDTHLLIAQTLLFSRGGGTAAADQARAELRQASDSLKTAARLGRAEERHLCWNMGWAYFLAGNYGESFAATEKALALAPDMRFALGLNAALALWEGEKRDEAIERLEDAFRWAETHPLASDAFYFRQMIQTLDGLVEARPADGLDVIRKRLKEAFVSLTLRKTGTITPTAASIGPLKFTVPVLDEQGRIVGRDLATQYPTGTGRVDFLFDFSGLSKGKQVVQKVHWQGREAAWLARVIDWNGAEAGRSLWSIRAPVTGTIMGLAPGRYVVELYVDFNLAQSGEFEILNR